MYSDGFIEPPPEIWRTNFELPRWAAQTLIRYSAPYKIVYGGRNSSKSWAVAASILYLITKSKRRLRVMIMREFDVAIEDSGLALCAQLIDMIYAGQGWTVHKRTIRYGPNGSTIRFRGLSDRTESSLRSVEGIDIFWFEEGQYMSIGSFETLLPTVRGGAEFWCTFNPRYRQDPIWANFLTDTERARQAIVMQVNYDSNPWLDPRDAQAIEAAKIDDPIRFAHIYLGQPDDEGDARKVLTYATVMSCVEAYQKWAPANGWAPTGRVHAGLDLADTGADFNALVARRGPLIFHAERWTGSRQMPREGVDPEDWDEIKSLYFQTCQRAHHWCVRNGVSRLFYDAGGLGGPARSLFQEIARVDGRKYRRRGINFGGAVTGPTVMYDRNDKNEDVFHRRNSQLWWDAHLRGQRTLRLLDGHRVDPEHCLFIDPKCSRNLGRLLEQLSQPEWEENSSGKIVVEKQPKLRENSTAKMPSPDLGDGTVLAFAFGSRSGLKARAA